MIVCSRCFTVWPRKQTVLIVSCNYDPLTDDLSLSSCPVTLVYTDCNLLTHLMLLLHVCKQYGSVLTRSSQYWHMCIVVPSVQSVTVTTLSVCLIFSVCPKSVNVKSQEPYTVCSLVSFILLLRNHEWNPVFTLKVFWRRRLLSSWSNSEFTGLLDF